MTGIFQEPTSAQEMAILDNPILIVDLHVFKCPIVNQTQMLLQTALEMTKQVPLLNTYSNILQFTLFLDSMQRDKAHFCHVHLLFRFQTRTQLVTNE